MRLFLACWVVILARADDLTQCSLLLNRQDFASATTCASNYLGAHPNSPDALVVLAQAQIGSNAAVSAMRTLKEALRIDPQNIDALYYMGKLSGVLAQGELQRLFRI